MEKITINAVDNGLIVEVGCKKLVYQKDDGYKQFLADLKSYLKNPEKAQEEIFKRWGIKEVTSGGFQLRWSSHPAETEEEECPIQLPPGYHPALL